jgi:hypothetical protein
VIRVTGVGQPKRRLDLLAATHSARASPEPSQRFSQTLDKLPLTEDDSDGFDVIARTANVVQLNPGTLKAFDAHIRQAEAQMDKALHGNGPFLWSETGPTRVPQLRQGNIVAQLWTGKAPIPIPNGLIHDWIGAVFIPDTTVRKTLALVQDYNNHKTIYRPDVLDSRLISNDGNHFKIHLRLLKKKVITVILDTDHDVHYLPVDRTRWICRSRTTRIVEVENPGPREIVLPPDTGHGFLWRLYSYWRFEEVKGGVFVECRAISLTRDVPFGLGWIIEPIVQKLPRESLVNTLEATRHALALPNPRTS